MWFGVISSGNTIGHAHRSKWKCKERGGGRHNPRPSRVLGEAVRDDNRERSRGFLRFINGDFDSFVRYTRTTIHTERDSCLNHSNSLCSQGKTRTPRHLNVLYQLLEGVGLLRKNKPQHLQQCSKATDKHAASCKLNIMKRPKIQTFNKHQWSLLGLFVAIINFYNKLTSINFMHSDA